MLLDGNTLLMGLRSVPETTTLVLKTAADSPTHSSIFSTATSSFTEESPDNLITGFSHSVVLFVPVGFHKADSAVSTRYGTGIVRGWDANNVLYIIEMISGVFRSHMCSLPPHELKTYERPGYVPDQQAREIGRAIVLAAKQEAIAEKRRQRGEVPEGDSQAAPRKKAKRRKRVRPAPDRSTSRGADAEKKAKPAARRRSGLKHGFLLGSSSNSSGKNGDAQRRKKIVHTGIHGQLEL